MKGSTLFILLVRAREVAEWNNFSLLFRLQVIAAIGEQKASKALQEAATVIAESPSALQVRKNVIRLSAAWYGKKGKRYILKATLAYAPGRSPRRPDLRNAVKRYYLLRSAESPPGSIRSFRFTAAALVATVRKILLQCRFVASKQARKQWK